MCRDTSPPLPPIANYNGIIGGSSYHISGGSLGLEYSLDYEDGLALGQSITMTIKHDINDEDPESTSILFESDLPVEMSYTIPSQILCLTATSPTCTANTTMCLSQNREQHKMEETRQITEFLAQQACGVNGGVLREMPGRNGHAPTHACACVSSGHPQNQRYRVGGLYCFDIELNPTASPTTVAPTATPITETPTVAPITASPTMAQNVSMSMLEQGNGLSHSSSPIVIPHHDGYSDSLSKEITATNTVKMSSEKQSQGHAMRNGQMMLVWISLLLVVFAVVCAALLRRRKKKVDFAQYEEEAQRVFRGNGNSAGSPYRDFFQNGGHKDKSADLKNEIELGKRIQHQYRGNRSDDYRSGGGSDTRASAKWEKSRLLSRYGQDVEADVTKQNIFEEYSSDKKDGNEYHQSYLDRYQQRNGDGSNRGNNLAFARSPLDPDEEFQSGSSLTPKDVQDVINEDLESIESKIV